ncbi:LysR family transcriptional regulator [bacterium]|nr:LysR family transcriptional regulator [bacterium]
MQQGLRNVSFSDLEIVSILVRYQSLRALARDLKLTISNVSKKISRIEAETGRELIKRSTNGYLLTQEGERLAKVARHLLAESEALFSESHSAEFSPKKWITIGSRGFLNALLAPILIKLCEQQKKEMRFRFIDFSPEEIVVAAFRSSLDIAFTLEECFLGERWQSVRIGQTRRILLARADHPLAMSQDISQLVEFQVLRSAYWDGNNVVSSGDLLPGLKKHWGHEVQTAATAIPILQNSDCVAFLPRLAVARALESGSVVEIFPGAASSPVMPVYLHVNMETIQQNLYRKILSAAEKTVEQFG